jgi:hypothetical protein
MTDETAGFDHSRVVRVTKWIRPEFTIERGGGVPDGRREIWARHEGHPELDALLVTVHYNYAYQDNATIGGVAARIARLLGTREPTPTGEDI